MSKVFLVSPSEKGILEDAGDRPPLGIAYIGGYLRENGHDVRLYDMNHIHIDELVLDVKEEKPDVVGVSLYTSPLYYNGMNLGKVIKQVNPEVKLVAGGYHSTVMPESTFPIFNQVVLGEGEYAMEKIARGDESEIVVGSLVDLVSLPKPARDLLPMEKYNMMQKGKRTATALTSRGCPNACAFCGNLPYNKKVRFTPINKITSELEELVDLGYEGIYFYDELFTANKERVKKLTDRIKGMGLSYRIATRADKLDKDIAKWLGDSGCEIVSLGIESGNDYILRKVRKRMTTSQNKDAVRMLAEEGIDVKGFFIIGLPGESYETARQTIEFAEELKKEGLTFADFYPLVPFPGSPIFNNPKNFGIKIIDKNWGNYCQAGVSEIKSVVETEYLKANEIKSLVEEAKSRWKS